jgi:hypothetical protein
MENEFAPIISQGFIERAIAVVRCDRRTQTTDILGNSSRNVYDTIAIRLRLLNEFL